MAFFQPNGFDVFGSVEKALAYTDRTAFHYNNLFPFEAF
jgi:hypothetical protein